MMNPLPFEPAHISTAKAQPVVRLPSDVYNYAAYLAQVSRKSLADVLGQALRYAFANIGFDSAEVYDIKYSGEDAPAKGE